jgi:hypothetical protein
MSLKQTEFTLKLKMLKYVEDDLNYLLKKFY